MTRWADFAAEQPDLAAGVRSCFAVRKHATMATLRRDGSPRISGTEVDFDDEGQVVLGSMPGARKAQDLLRDPRVALHSPTVDPPEEDPGAWPGEAKIAGRAVEVPGRGADEAHRFTIDVTEVVRTRVAESGDHLVITAWHPDRGLEVHRRF